MTRNGSDKGNRTWHTYTTVYSALFAAFRAQPIRIFELGLGTNDPDLPSSMGPSGRPGASLRAWRELFPNAQVFGADIDRNILFDEPGIKTFYCDQCDPKAVSSLWSTSELLPGSDIIIDDGLHTFEANLTFLEGSLVHLRPGGFYVIEDILTCLLERWQVELESRQKGFPTHEFALVEVPNAFNEVDNNLVVIRRRQ